MIEFNKYREHEHTSFQNFVGTIVRSATQFLGVLKVRFSKN